MRFAALRCDSDLDYLDHPPAYEGIDKQNPGSPPAHSAVPFPNFTKHVGSTSALKDRVASSISTQSQDLTVSSSFPSAASTHLVQGNALASSFSDSSDSSVPPRHARLSTSKILPGESKNPPASSIPTKTNPESKGKGKKKVLDPSEDDGDQSDTPKLRKRTKKQAKGSKKKAKQVEEDEDIKMEDGDKSKNDTEEEQYEIERILDHVSVDRHLVSVN